MPVAVILGGLSFATPGIAFGSGSGGSGACYRGFAGETIDCGGGYVAPQPVAPTHHPTRVRSGPPTTVVVLAYYVANGPNGACMALGPARATSNMTVANWLATVNYPPCPAVKGPAPPPLDPVTLAVQFWKTIPLPVPKPAIPPGYAITGKTAYLVTHGTTNPPTYSFNTPLGQLTVKAAGSYAVNWGDAYQPGWQGPYTSEGQPYPNGQITHTYDYTGTYTVTVREQWTATWTLAGAAGTLAGLQTTATVPNFQAVQYQAVITN
jgi:hypothetical protein